LGVSGMSNTTLQERMAGNTRQTHVAIQAAEAALRAAETELQAAATAFSTGGAWRGGNINSGSSLIALFNSGDASTNGLFSQVSPPGTNIAAFANSNVSADWSGGGVTTMAPAITTLTQQPVYIIEYTGRIGNPPLDPNGTQPDLRAYAFRITAMGWGEGANPTSRYMLQSHFRVTLL